MSTSATVTTTLTLDDRSTHNTESATVTSTTTLSQNDARSAEGKKNGNGSFTAQFALPAGTPTPIPDFTATRLVATPNRPPLHTYEIKAVNAAQESITFLFFDGLANGKYDEIQLNNSNTRIWHNNFSFPIHSGTLSIEVDNGLFKPTGVYQGAFRIISVDSINFPREVTITGNFNFTTIPE